MEAQSRHFLIASAPAALLGLATAGVDRAATPLLLLAIALLASRLWAELFARRRGLPLDSGWILSAWLFVLLLPPATPPILAALALSFGLVFGCHAFGGTGRYLVNPALLAVIFLTLSYPPAPTVIEESVGLTLLSLLGAVYLVVTHCASARVLAGALGAVILGSLAASLPWQSQLALGQFAFVLAFVATDPTVRPVTAGGCWAYGILFGALTVLLRTLDPSHPEGSLPALLLASLCVPLLDRMAGRLPGRAAVAIRESKG